MIKLIHGNFEDTKVDKKQFDIDLIIADPPDNIGLKYNGFNDKISDGDYERNIHRWLELMGKLTSGPIFFTFNEKWTALVERTIDQLEIPIIQRIQWYYTFGQDQTRRGRYSLCYRPIYWLNSDYVIPESIKIPSQRQIKYKDKRASSNGKMPPNVWEFPRICGTFKERRPWSPTQLNELLVERIIKGHCRPGGLVLDPFIGSGTTAIICQKFGVNCIGIETSKETIKHTAEFLGVQYE